LTSSLKRAKRCPSATLYCSRASPTNDELPRVGSDHPKESTPCRGTVLHRCRERRGEFALPGSVFGQEPTVPTATGDAAPDSALETATGAKVGVRGVERPLVAVQRSSRWSASSQRDRQERVASDPFQASSRT
jgi:hypothetical protein